MKHLRLRLTPKTNTIHPFITILTKQEYVSEACMVNWNIANTEQPVLLFTVRGDCERFAAALDGLSTLSDYEVVPIDDSQFNVHLWLEPTVLSHEPFAMFTQNDLILMPPLKFRGGSASGSLVGSPAALQAVVDSLTSKMSVDVQHISEYTISQGVIVSQLSDRQREAVETGLAVGYYESPRQATHEDIAEHMGCTPSTVSRHIQKAEAKIISTVLD